MPGVLRRGAVLRRRSTRERTGPRRRSHPTGIGPGPCAAHVQPRRHTRRPVPGTEPERRLPDPSPPLQRIVYGGVMRWRFWLAAGVVSTCLLCAPQCGHDCPARQCRASEAIRMCVDGADAVAPGTDALCEVAWQATRAEQAAVGGSLYALEVHDGPAAKRWADRAQETIEGARILHNWGELQQQRGDLQGAETTMLHALSLQRDRDPARATNTALFLLELARSRQPADQSIWWARVAWEQAGRGGNETMRTCAAFSLLEILLDLGELPTAVELIDQMDEGRTLTWQVARDSAQARLEAARGRITTAIALFPRGGRVDRSKRTHPLPSPH